MLCFFFIKINFNKYITSIRNQMKLEEKNNDIKTNFTAI